jgi:Flp pilus assembly pilin Flp
MLRWMPGQKQLARHHNRLEECDEMNPIPRLALDDIGSETVEYALMISFLAIATVAGLTILGTGVADIWTNLQAVVTSAGF